MKIYSKPVKIIALLILIVSIAVAGVFSTFASLAISLGCYSEGDNWHNSYIVSNAQYNQAITAEEWYDYYEKQQNGTLTLSEQYNFDFLTDKLKNSSVGIIRVDSQGNEVPIAGFNSIATMYEHLNNKVLNDECVYKIYFNNTSDVNDTFKKAYNTFNELLPKCYNYLIYIRI